MVLGIAEDFTADINLDVQLKNTPSSGLYVNSGVHPSITLENLLAFLPYHDVTFSSWTISKTYGVYETSRDRRDIVTFNNKIYQSIKSGIAQAPDQTDSEYWIETNLESLKLKNFLYKTIDRVNSELHLTKRLIDNQYIYDRGQKEFLLSQDYSAVVIEPKGSDYVSIRINSISLQVLTNDPVNVYLVSDNVLLDTFVYTPMKGVINWQDMDFVYKGSSPLFVIIDSQSVLLGNKHYDPYVNDGFMFYSASGKGDSPESAKYSTEYSGKGIGLNISAYLDSDYYVEKNIQNFGGFIRATFEYMAFLMFWHNSNNRSNRAETIQLEDDILLAEIKNLQGDSSISKFYKERKRAFKMLEKTFDTELSEGSDDTLDITIGSI